MFRSDHLRAASIALFRRELPRTALEFATTVLRQAARPLGAPPSSEEDEVRLAGAIAALLNTSSDPAPREAMAHLLAGEPPLLAAIFQNVDLLYTSNHPGADQVSMLLMEAIAIASDT